MLEQETASIMAYVLEKAGYPLPYYNEIPQSFSIPAVYFPVPEIELGGDTLVSYSLNYTWSIRFFHRNTPLAHSLALPVLTAIQSNRNFIPLIDTDANLTGKGFRIRDPILSVEEAATGVIQLQLNWKSIRPYHEEPVEKMMVYDINMITRKAKQMNSKNLAAEEGGNS